jgi:hypothetical protein
MIHPADLWAMAIMSRSVSAHQRADLPMREREGWSSPDVRRGLACRYWSSPAGGRAYSRRRDRMAGRAAPALSSAMAIETARQQAGRGRRLEGAYRVGQPKFWDACPGHAGEDGLEVEDGGDAGEGASGDGGNGDNAVGGDMGTAVISPVH